MDILFLSIILLLSIARNFSEEVSCNSRVYGTIQDYYSSVVQHTLLVEESQNYTFSTCDDYVDVYVKVLHKISGEEVQECQNVEPRGLYCMIECALVQGEEYTIELAVSSWHLNILYILQITCEEGCYEGYGDWLGDEVDEKLFIETDSFEECCDYCKNIPVCRHWSWKRYGTDDHLCKLFKHNPTRIRDGDSTVIRDRLSPAYRHPEQTFLNCGSTSDHVYITSANLDCEVYDDESCLFNISLIANTSFIDTSDATTLDGIFVTYTSMTGEYKEAEELYFCSRFSENCDYGDGSLGYELYPRTVQWRIDFDATHERGPHLAHMIGSKPGTVCAEWKFDIPRYPECDSNQFRCWNNECIYSNARCDGYIDCKDNSDELECEECSNGNFQCDDGSCTEYRDSRCDGRRDCRDWSDELNCDK